MKIWYVCVMLLCSFVLSYADSESRIVDLIIIAGQSNAVGFDTQVEQLPKSPIDKDILFWWRCGAYPPDEYDSSSHEQWTILQGQEKGTSLNAQSQNFSNPKGGFGPEIGLARYVKMKQPKRDIAILKVAYNATSIRQWAKNSKKPSCYQALVSEFNSAVQAGKKKGITFRVCAFVWIQGESDALYKLSKEYMKNFNAMLKNLKTDLNAPDLIVLLGLNTRFCGGNEAVRNIVQVQKNIAETSPYISYVDTSSCEIVNPYHFSSKGMLDVGELFAKELLKIEKACATKK